MGKRLSDTAALVREGGEGDVEKTIRVKEISNGFLVCESEYNSGTGECRSVETFHRNRPVVEQARVKRGSGPGEGPGSLRDAAGYLKSQSGLMK